MYGYNAEPPIAIPIYTVLLYCVIIIIIYYSLHDDLQQLQVIAITISYNYFIVSLDQVIKAFKEKDIKRLKKLVLPTSKTGCPKCNCGQADMDWKCVILLVAHK